MHDHIHEKILSRQCVMAEINIAFETSSGKRPVGFVSLDFVSPARRPRFPIADGFADLKTVATLCRMLLVSG
jgi:hypothetical protein